MPGTDTIPARSVAEHLLAETGQALETGDVDRFGGLLLLPHTVASYSGQRRLATMEDVQDLFDAVRRYYISDGITRVERYVDACDYVSEDEIKSTHVSQLFKGNRPFRQAYPTLSTLKRTEGVWQIAGGQYAVSDCQDHEMLFTEAPHPVGDARDRAVFQTVLDEVTLSFLTGNFGLLLHRTQLPLFIQSRNGSQLLADAAQLQADFELYRSEFELQNITDIVRTIRSVMPVGEGKLVGTYLTHVLSGHRLVIPSYTSSMHMDQGADGIWRASAVMQAMGHAHFKKHMPGAGQGHAPFEVIMTAPLQIRGH